MERNVSRIAANTREGLAQWNLERPDLDLYGLQFSMCVLRLAKVVEDEFERRCRERFELGANDVRILLALRRSGEPFMLRPTDLFRSLLITSGAVSKQVDRLSAMGLVRRRPDPGHGGGRLVQLTAKGRSAADAAAQMVAGEGRVHEALSSFSQKQRAQALDFLISLMDRLE